MFDSIEQELHTTKTYLFAICRLAKIKPETIAKESNNTEANALFALAIMENLMMPSAQAKKSSPKKGRKH